MTFKIDAFKGGVKCAARPEVPVSDIGEFGLIKRLAAIVGSDAGKCSGGINEIVGIGDDCAVFPADLLFPGAVGSLLLSTDTMVAGRHFRFEFSTPFQVGAKLLNVNASDIAAMGGVPRFALVAIQLPADISGELVEELYGGIKQSADRLGIRIVGGDTTKSDTAAFSITIGGTVEGSPVLRSTAQYGDDIWVSGPIGAAQLGLGLLKGDVRPGQFGSDCETAAISRHRTPEARVAAGRYLQSRGLASAMIDISDGTAQDLGHIAALSSVSAVIDIAALPLAAGISGLPSDQVDQLRRFALSGGDDYELLFTAHPQHRSAIEGAVDAGIAPVRIGTIAPIERGTPAAERVQLRHPDGRLTGAVEWCGDSGYRHF